MVCDPYLFRKVMKNAVAAALPQRLLRKPQDGDPTREVNIPMENRDRDHRRRRKRLPSGKVLPGYTLCKMEPDRLALVSYPANVRGGKIGHCLPAQAARPSPLTEQEIYDLGVERHEIVTGYQVGDTVRSPTVPPRSALGTVEELEPDKDRVRVVVSMSRQRDPRRS